MDCVCCVCIVCCERDIYIHHVDVYKRQVTPSSRLTRSSNCNIDSVVSGSRALVASSQSNMDGSVANARAIPTRCF